MNQLRPVFHALLSPSTASADGSVPGTLRDVGGRKCTDQSIPAAVNDVVTRTLDAAFAVHRELGPGLLESVYEACLRRELTLMQIPHRAQVRVPVTYKGMEVSHPRRLDLLVDDRVIVEVKAHDVRQPMIKAQLLTYLKLTGIRVGLLINFNAPLLKDGIRRVAC